MNLQLNQYNIIAKFTDDVSRIFYKGLTQEDVSKATSGDFADKLAKRVMTADERRKRLAEITETRRAYVDWWKSHDVDESGMIIPNDDDLIPPEGFQLVDDRPIDADKAVNDGEAKAKGIASTDIGIIAEAILSKSLYYCPIETGNLRNSVRLKKIGAGIIITYGAEYATYVHECEYHHDTPTQRKFLEDAAVEVIEDIEAEYGNDVVLPEIRILLNPLTIFINILTDKGEAITGRKGNQTARERQGDRFISPYDMRLSFLKGEEDDKRLEDMLEIINNLNNKTLNKLSKTKRMSEASANAFSWLAMSRFNG